MIPILDWIFEGIVGWVSSIASQLLDAVSGLFLEALGTDMTAMEEYFPFVTKAYGVMQVTAYAILILIVLWQLFRAFGGPITEAENPWHLVVRGALFGFLIGYAKPIFSACLTIARAPYTSLMDLSTRHTEFLLCLIAQHLIFCHSDYTSLRAIYLNLNGCSVECTLQFPNIILRNDFNAWYRLFYIGFKGS